MRVTAFLPTHDLPEEAVDWMQEVRSIFDELIVFLDESRLTKGTASRVAKVATHVRRYRAANWLDWDLAAMAGECEGDWLFLIERDEQLSPEWRQPVWRLLLEDERFTHYWLPRHWTVPGRKYISASPWWSDPHPRLFRNRIPGTTFPKRLHDPIHVPGAGGSLTHLGVYHHALRLCSRSQREQRVQRYDEIRPGGALQHYYLYEDYNPELKRLPAARRLKISRELGSMEPLISSQVLAISLEVADWPQTVTAGTLFWLTVIVRNGTARRIAAFQPFPVRLAYHWRTANKRELVQFEGSRTELFPALQPFSQTRSSMMVVAPVITGELVLQVTLLQESVCWFEHVKADIAQESVIEVLPALGLPKGARPGR